ncbi:MarR family transcriptional regulator [Caballeronia pedi]|uniref:MarR family transcriptional regulator n=1 Tax=Caballeronia pedi TaxID=1777141 RepID=A0A157ZC37_9BURK|nr:MarR family transcriptional regulator [Caballeronia pedi]SAK43096.1 MarR family transcriptional regulator [Caballeronia pedi]
MDHYTPETFSLTKSVGFAVNKARNVLVGELDAALKDLGITTQQTGILMSMRGGVTQTPFELSKLLGIDTGLMTRMLDKLETRGLLQRTRSLEDRRVVNLTLTREGEKVADTLPHIVPVVLNRRLRKFSKSEFQELRRLLDKFLED